MICPDLYKDIVEYTPLADLLLLSKASPIFDAVIKWVGRNVFYYGARFTDLGDAKNNEVKGYMIIESDFGQKRLLMKQGNTYRDVYSNNIMMDRTIATQYSNEKNDCLYNISKYAMILHDSKKDVVITVDGNRTMITIRPIDFDGSVNTMSLYNAVNIYPVTDLSQVSYVDMNTGIYKYDEFNGRNALMQRGQRYVRRDNVGCGNRIYYGRFKILYDKVWLTSGPIIPLW